MDRAASRLPAAERVELTRLLRKAGPTRRRASGRPLLIRKRAGVLHAYGDTGFPPRSTSDPSRAPHSASKGSRVNWPELIHRVRAPPAEARLFEGPEGIAVCRCLRQFPRTSMSDPLNGLSTGLK